MKIRKAVIPVAGRGTRFLPATKQIPKEMIPILNTPMIHYPVLEAVESGIEQIIFVNSCGKASIEDYFDLNLELENFLRQGGKEKQAEEIEAIGSMIEVVSVRQKEPLGLGHALYCARHVVGEETFAVLLGDDIIRSQRPAIGQLMEVSSRLGGKSVIGITEVKRHQTDRYGIVSGPFLADDKNTLKVEEMVEKPSPAQAPSCWAAPGRYLLSPDIFEILGKIPKGMGGEYQLTDALKELAREDCVYAHLFEGDRFDTGSLEGYLRSTVDFALRDESTRAMMEEIMREKAREYQIRL